MSRMLFRFFSVYNCVELVCLCFGGHEGIATACEFLIFILSVRCLPSDLEGPLVLWLKVQMTKVQWHSGRLHS